MNSKINMFLLNAISLGLVAVLSYCGLRPNPQLNDKRPVEDENNHRINYDPVGSGTGTAFDMWQAIEAYLGVRYRWGGRTVRGMDCSGFVLTVFKETLNVDLPRRVRDMFERGKDVGKQDLQFGDLVFFRKARNARVSHVGIFVGNDQFAHASISSGVMISKLTESYYDRRFAGARRLFSIND